MKHTFEEFFNMLKLDRQKSPWSKQLDFHSRLEQLKEEVDEVELALKNNDMPNFKEELGDVMWDILGLIVLAEEKDICTGKEVIQSAIDKLKRRKPWIFTGEKLSLEQEKERWQEAKRLEKIPKKRQNLFISKKLQ